jgi:hypothetical protein
MISFMIPTPFAGPAAMEEPPLYPRLVAGAMPRGAERRFFDCTKGQ